MVRVSYRIKSCQTRNFVLLGIALFILTAVVYMPVGGFEFINFDDTVYITHNSQVTGGITGANISWAFTATDAANWHPLTWLSHMLDVQLYGLNPRGHHLTNAGIHTVSSLLLLLLLFRLTGSLWQSTFVAALFALHPLRVESVAWVSERKDVLSAFFWLLTLLLYAEYVVKQRTHLYVLTLTSFMLGLMSKPMLVTLPVVMLLLDFWPLGRYHHGGPALRQRSWRIVALIKEKIPFLVAALLTSAITIYAQHAGGATRNLVTVPLVFRVENALIAYVKYIIKTVWPHDLAILYPLPASLPLWHAICALLILLIVSVTVIRVRRTSPYLAVGWYWYLVTLVPVIGLIQVGNQSIADRYSYIPTIGLYIMFAGFVAETTKNVHHRQGILALLALVVIIPLSALTRKQLGYWQNNISLYQHTLQVTTDNMLINYNLGLALAEQGDLDGAIQAYNEALRVNPDYANAHNNKGIALARKGELAAARQEFTAAIRLHPTNANAHNNLGLALAGKGNLDAAIGAYQQALRIQPQYADAHYNLGLALAGKGELDAAIGAYRHALRISPHNADMHNNLGLVLAEKGELDAAIREYQEVLRLKPDSVEGHNNLGLAFASMGKHDAAIREYREALRIRPDDKGVRDNLEHALTQITTKSSETK